MPLDYDDNRDESWAALLPVLEGHAEWFHQLVEYLFYSEDYTQIEGIKKPTSFAQWVVYANRGNTVPPEVVETLNNLHNDLFSVADSLLDKVQEIKSKPSYKEFKNFLTIYEEFLRYIRRLEKDMLIEGSGYDSYTGLRSSKMLINDVDRELKRLARQGKNFCIVMIRLDNYSKIQECAAKEEVEGYVKLIASLIKLSVRSFDDAYYMDGDKFAVCLKQSIMSGGISAIERLKQELESQDIIIDLDGESRPLSMSCCIAEPVIGDEAQDLINNLYEDLKNVDTERSDTVLKYHELSPLQRYIQEQEGV